MIYLNIKCLMTSIVTFVSKHRTRIFVYFFIFIYLFIKHYLEGSSSTGKWTVNFTSIYLSNAVLSQKEAVT